MKYLIPAVALAILSVSSSAIAATTSANHNANNSGLRPYVGFDYGYSHKENITIYQGNKNNVIGKFSDKLHYAIPHIGIRTGKHFGFELGYFHNMSQGKTRSFTMADGTKFMVKKTRMEGLYIDGNAYLPITNSLEAIGSLGVAAYHDRYKAVNAYVAKKHHAMLRLGAGLQYNIDKNVSFRAMARTHGNGLMSTAGINFSF
ncbi:MAG: OmpA-like transrane domain [Candidatus Midichloriaceae bacterium]|jgi:hypothetical protein|nr:OmpA-like transrane domain [Candidatus Midichloriaceae bacterium]